MRGTPEEWSEILAIITMLARRRYWWLDFDELVSVASLEAVKAEGRWDPATGCSLRNFVMIRAAGSMRDYLKLHENLKRTQMPARIPAPGCLHDEVMARVELQEGLAVLRPIERECLLSFARGETTIEIGRRLRICQSRVSQHLMAARAAIREWGKHERTFHFGRT